MRSVRHYLLTILIALLTLTSFLAAVQSYRQSVDRSEQLFDQDLQLLSAAVLANVGAKSPQGLESLAIQLWQRQELRFASALAPQHLITQTAGFSEQNFAGKRWRVYAHAQDDWWVVVAQPLQQRQSLADEVVIASIYPVLWSLPLQALLIWLVVSRALAPLKRFSAQLASKKANDLTPVKLPAVPEELQQVLNTTNQLLTRLHDAFEREKRFASDVAHELRNPLSTLQINLHNALSAWQQSGQQQGQHSMAQLQQGVERMSQLIEQIMLLNRTNPEVFQAQMQPLDWAELCREVIAEQYPQLEKKQQQIELLGEEQLTVRADPFALKLLMSNLLGNACKYTPAGGQLQLKLSRMPNMARLEVEDNGPGMAEQEFERAFDRFYRVGGDRHQSGTPGSGLGLAIVKELVKLHQGRIWLSHSQWPTGLKVTVELPL
ncbi:sensor histidine kinase [Rheinheimera sp.]|uniref:sensor histidine kinase n=1 Tax=Rheinheimera sp. TaxID=1869214 RepID=UPI003AF6F9EE